MVAQQLVLTKSMDLEDKNLQHGHFRLTGPLPFKAKTKLGRGGFGHVYRARGLKSTALYAVKKVARPPTASRRDSTIFNMVITEIEVLKRVRHRHIVNFVGSYTHARHIGLILSPVADMDLRRYLKHVGLSKFQELRTFFGCLARGLEFMHAQRIRHKDIKPSNILVHRGSVMYTDFGLALDFGAASSATTIGPAKAVTPFYSSPEAARAQPRNTASDVWSLGVVLLEMAAALKGTDFDGMCDFLKGAGTRAPYPRDNISGVREAVEACKLVGNQGDNVALDWALRTLKRQPNRRPTAGTLCEWIVDSTDFCGECCVASGNPLGG
jgi:serine/threonine protein kinase